MSAKFRIPFLRRRTTKQEDNRLKPATEMFNIKILKKDRLVEWYQDQISFEVSCENGNEVSLLYGLLLKEQKKDPNNGEISYVKSFGVGKEKKGKRKLTIYLSDEALKQIKTKNDIISVLGKVLVIRTRTNNFASAH